jgi:hypothetical protein
MIHLPLGNARQWHTVERGYCRLPRPAGQALAREFRRRARSSAAHLALVKMHCGRPRNFQERFEPFPRLPGHDSSHAPRPHNLPFQYPVNGIRRENGFLTKRLGLVCCEVPIWPCLFRGWHRSGPFQTDAGFLPHFLFAWSLLNQCCRQGELHEESDGAGFKPPRPAAPARISRRHPASHLYRAHPPSSFGYCENIACREPNCGWVVP